MDASGHVADLIVEMKTLPLNTCCRQWKGHRSDALDYVGAGHTIWQRTLGIRASLLGRCPAPLPSTDLMTTNHPDTAEPDTERVDDSA